MTSGPVTLSSLPRNPGKALVVDDDPGIRELYSEVLEAMGFQVETAADGAKALERIRSVPFALIISDIRMPGLTGFELYEKAEQVRPGSRAHFIFTTGLVDSLTAHEYMVATEKPSIIKPARVQNIQQAVLELFARKTSTSTS